MSTTPTATPTEACNPALPACHGFPVPCSYHSPQSCYTPTATVTGLPPVVSTTTATVHNTLPRQLAYTGVNVADTLGLAMVLAIVGAAIMRSTKAHKH